MKPIDKHIKLLISLLTDEQKHNLYDGNKRSEYAKMLENSLKINRHEFETKELFSILIKQGLDNPFDMSEYIIEETAKVLQRDGFAFYANYVPVIKTVIVGDTNV